MRESRRTIVRFPQIHKKSCYRHSILLKKILDKSTWLYLKSIVIDLRLCYNCTQWARAVKRKFLSMYIIVLSYALQNRLRLVMLSFCLFPFQNDLNVPKQNGKSFSSSDLTVSKRPGTIATE